MEYKNFKNKHHGQKIIVSGCGVSASNLKKSQEQIVIGVNDLSRLYVPDYLVVLNDKSSFKGDRWNYIENTTCPFIFTHIKSLQVAEEKKVMLQLGRYGGCDLEKEQVDYCSNSTYVACIIAAFMGASKIGLIGCDFVNNHFFENTGEHVLSKKINTINQEYSALKQSMDRKNIEFVNLSPISRITCLTKQTLEEF